MARINKLILHGFKSFGKWTELTFGPGLNLIVGPNGSGKSNVCDALTFVLGRLSAKQLRAERSANLIYNGGKSRQPAQKAEVTIVLANSGEFALPDPEIRITRTVFEDGSSRYQIGRKTCTRAEVLELLHSAGIDPHGWNIVEQGMIARLVEMSAIERRRLVEEISGIDIFNEKKEQALAKLEGVQQRLAEAAIVLRERRALLKAIKSDRDSALAWQSLQGKLRAAKAGLAKARLEALQARAGQLEDELKGFSSELERLKLQEKQIEQEIASTVSKLEVLAKQLSESEPELKAYTNEREKVERELAQLSSSAAAAKSLAQELERQAARLSAEAKELERRAGNLDTELVSIEKCIEESEAAQAEVEREKSRYCAEHSLADIEEIESGLARLEQELEAREAEAEKAQAGRTELLRALDRAELERQTAQLQLERAREAAKEQGEKVKAVARLKEEFAAAIHRLNELLAEDARVLAELQKFRAELAQAKAELSTAGYSEAGLKLLSAGLAVARLDELYSTEPELAKAIEAALGPARHALVVRNRKAALRALAFLKKKKLGRLALVWATKGKALAGSIYEKISIEPGYEEIFKARLGKTFFCKSDEEAALAAEGGTRCVSAGGNLFEPGLAIGGWTKPPGARHRLRSAKEAIAALEARQAQLAAELCRAKERKIQLESEIAAAEAKGIGAPLEEAKAAFRAAEEKVLAIRAALERSSSQLDAVLSAIAQLKQSRAELRERLAKSKRPEHAAYLAALAQRASQLAQQASSAKLKRAELTALAAACRQQLRAKSAEAADLKRKAEQKASELERIEAQRSAARSRLAQLTARQLEIKSAHAAVAEERAALLRKLSELERAKLELGVKQRELEAKQNSSQLQLLQLRSEESAAAAELASYGQVEPLLESQERLLLVIAELERQIAELGPINMRAAETYDRLEAQWRELLEKKRTIVKEKAQLLKLIDELERAKLTQFMSTLQALSEKFSELFGKLTGKGKAWLELTLPNKPFESGLAIKVMSSERPIDLRALSGGEKALTALAFLFAIQRIRPAHFYFLDEVDATLDKANSQLLAQLLKAESRQTQYIVITHNDAVLQAGDQIIGIALNPKLEQSCIATVKFE